jgi:hypothetical protein
MPAEPPNPIKDDPEPEFPEEVFQQLLEDSEQAIRKSAPKEPSARARMVAERLRNEEKPEPWRAAPDVIPLKRRRKVPNWARNAVLALLAAGVTAVALNPGAARSLVTGGPSQPQHRSPALATPAPGTPAAQDPFAGTPAEGWGAGANAITPPAARPVGAMTRDQVASALQLVKEYLVDTNLDPSVLSGARPQLAMDEIDPLDTTSHNLYDAAFTSADKNHNPLIFATRYDPKALKPVGDVVKVDGGMTFSAGQYGSVVVNADYTFVYAFTKADGSTDEVERVIVRRALGMQLGDPADVRVTAGKLWVVDNQSSWGDAGCDTSDGFVHPQFTGDEPSGAQPTGPASDPYDRSKPLSDLTGQCLRETRA